MAARRRAAMLEYRGKKEGCVGRQNEKEHYILYVLRRSHISKPMSSRSGPDSLTPYP